jgi:type III secretion protein O
MPEPYPLQSLLNVRQFREETAKRDVTVARGQVKEAQEACERKEQEVQQFKTWRVEEEERRWQHLFKTPVKIEGIDRFKAGLAALANQELMKEQELETAKQNLVASQNKLENAKFAASNARKNTAKIEAHKEIWSEDAKKEAERAEDLELEEFHSVSPLASASDES